MGSVFRRNAWWAIAILGAACGGNGPGRATPDAGADALRAGQDGGARHDGSQGKDAGGADGAPAGDAPGDRAASGDAPMADGSAADSGATCGGRPCYAGQSCVSGVCSFTSCTGANVPGDYATIQAAIDALTAGGASGTICLAAQTYAETLSISTGSISMQGVSAGQSIVTGITVDYASGLGDVTFNASGLSIGSVIFYSGANPGTGSSVITACALGSLSIEAGYENLSVTLDGDDISAGKTGTAIDIMLGNCGVTLEVENSYVHDSAYGLDFTLGVDSYYGASSTITLLNNTFAANTTAVSTPSGCTVCGDVPNVNYFNNIFVNNGLAVDTEAYEDTTYGNDALFGNTTNYAGIAKAGAGYVTTDPLLDAKSTPPGLLAGSPCRGAGDPSRAPPHDFWGRPRGSTPDIGAVQSSP